jgi:hypothetical protein
VSLWWGTDPSELRYPHTSESEVFGKPIRPDDYA